jgi:hypothetical protein
MGVPSVHELDRGWLIDRGLAGHEGQDRATAGEPGY